ncbi:EVE domain-containing protein [Sphaerospermopsis sp. LEGE 08334]|uniref:EVE domain-containing protein n=1 Tax=Sphaerospermopsis sp. LEGE 08334 TaxID=1828651 RepID=UPI00187DE235|nr:EVE domain-containing protein [Sphaerospermopsis sp. LEGE 08334]MBE9058979.1 EVE domain-containing protein [Sphaerospermopsis sp. LEGE 08334]
MNYWLMKSEPSVYSIFDLQTQKQTIWDGVRNYQARNFLKQMQVGDLAFFYHSNAEPPGIFGLMKIVQTGIADPTQFDSNSKYYDAKSTPESPRWLTVKVEFVELFSQPIFLSTLKEQFTDDELLVVKKGNRLSVIYVGESVAKNILAMNN